MLSHSSVISLLITTLIFFWRVHFMKHKVDNLCVCTLFSRWTVRADCMLSVLNNYSELLTLWDQTSDEGIRDTEMKARIIGVQSQMRTFSFLISRCINTLSSQHLKLKKLFGHGASGELSKHVNSVCLFYRVHHCRISPPNNRQLGKKVAVT